MTESKMPDEWSKKNRTEARARFEARRGALMRKHEACAGV
jgi:hypothetical protein